MAAELYAGGEKLAHGHPGWSISGAGGVVEHGPGLAEVVVLKFVSMIL